VEHIISKNDTTGILTYNVVPIEAGRQFYSLSTIRAHKLKNTELFTSMTPFIKISTNTEVYRTTTAIGRNNLAWDVGLLVPSSNKTKLLMEVIDKDMMFDDDVGKADVMVEQSSNSQIIKSDLMLKNKLSG
jgi:hypothetical protein